MAEHDLQQPHYTCPTCGASVIEEGQFCQPSCRPDHDFFLSRKLTVVPFGETRFEIHEEYEPIRTRRVALVHCGLLSPKGARALAELFAESPSIKREWKELREALWDASHYILELLACGGPRGNPQTWATNAPRAQESFDKARELLKKLEEEND